MADNPDITGGTVSVTAGTKIVTGVGTLWSTYGLLPGDMFGSDGYPTARIDTIDSDTSITLKDNWRGETLAASASYFIRYQADSSRYSALLGAVRKILNQPILTALAGLTGAADTISYFTGASTMATVAFKAWARSFLGLTPAANKLAYFDTANSAALVDFKAWARSLLGLTIAADKLPYGTGADTMALADLTAYARTLLDDPNASAAQTTLGISTFIKALLDDPDGSSALASLGVTKSMTSAGYYRFPGGVIIQWIAGVNALSDFAQLFPIGFPNGCYGLSCLPSFSAGSTNVLAISTSNVSNTSFDIRCRNVTSGAVGPVTNLPFFAIAVGF